MWYPSSASAPPAEPIDIDQAKAQCGVLPDEAYFDSQIAFLIKAARSHVEEYCSARFAEQTIVAQCDGFADFVRLPEGPLKSVTSIEFIDAAGDEQTLADTVYEEHRDGLEPSIGLKHGQSWPAIRLGSRITLAGVFGGDAPESVQHAMLLFIEDSFHNRENAKREDWTTLDALLCNHRRGF